MSRGPAGPAVLTVSELTADIRGLLDVTFGDLWVRGEISQPRTPASGHVYLTLKDAGAVLPAVMWRSSATRLRFRLEEGQEVLARGGIDVYPPHGKYQFVIRQLEPVGEGALRLAFEQLRARLEAEGLFAPERKRPLPTLPRRIALVTSRTGAAVRDMVTVIHRRHPGVDLVLLSVRVQGPGAAQEIAAALQRADRDARADVILVGRGGGSLEDLWAFNEEVVARAIAACRTPVVSAVGHETDTTIADLVADLRAATPSQAGELVVPVRAELLERLERERARLVHRMQVRLARAWQRVEALGDRPVLRAGRGLLASRHTGLE
ncbi:MAG: exodeoxyribonuclease VII large subunit, partial [Planctomycetota bacterium]|nr:exodeoxyribonuclease VII large subunit [Planctomycetota bacterium]